MKKILAILGLVIIGNTSFAINCDKYFTYDEKDCFRLSTEFIQYYIQCNLDKKIIPSNKKFDFKTDQSNIWNGISFMQEHFYDNSGNADKFEKKFPGKYNTLYSLEKTVYMERILHELGANAVGYYDYLIPNFDSFGKYNWETNLYYQTKQYKFIDDLNDKDQKIFLNKLEKQIKHFTNNDKFKDAEYLNTYILNIIAILKNIRTQNIEKQFIKSLKSLYNSKKQNSDIEKYVNSL